MVDCIPEATPAFTCVQLLGSARSELEATQLYQTWSIVVTIPFQVPLAAVSCAPTLNTGALMNPPGTEFDGTAALAGCAATRLPPTESRIAALIDTSFLSEFELIMVSRKPKSGQISGQIGGLPQLQNLLESRPKNLKWRLANLLSVALATGVGRLVLRVGWVCVAGVAKKH